MLLTLTANDPARTTLAVIREDTTDTGFRLLDGANWGNTAWDQHFSGPRGTQGAMAASGEPQNRTVVLPIRVVASSKDLLLRRLRLLNQQADLMRRYGGTLTVRLNNATFRSYFTVLSGSAGVAEWTSRTEANNRTLVTFEAVCAPYISGEPMGFTDSFDGYSIDAQGQVNYVTNPSFEAGSTGWLPNAGGETITLDTSAAVSGTQSLRVVTTSAANSGVYLPLSGLTGGTTITVACSLKKVSGAAGAYLRAIETSGALQSASSSVISSGSFQRTSLTITLSAGCTSLLLVVTNASATTVTFNLDAVQLVTGSVDLAYFDGDSDNVTWTGDRGNSRSQYIVGSKFDRYAYDSGSGTLVIGGGSVLPTSTAEKRIYVTGCDYSDAQAALKFTTGASVSTHEEFVIQRRQNSANYLMAGFTSGGNTFGIYTVVNGSAILRASATVGLSAATTYWVRFRAEGPVLICEYFTSQPTPTASPTSSITYTLTASEQAQFGLGKVGIRVVPGGTDYTYDDFKVEPFTYRLKAIPDEFTLDGVGGDVPALVDVGIASASALPFAMFGWADKPQPFNALQNGDFDGPLAASVAPAVASGWRGSGPYLNSTSTVSRVTTAAKFGTASAQVVTPGSATAEGAALSIYRRFKKGVTYSFSAWVRAASSTTSVTAFLGNIGITDFTQGNNVTLSTTWQQITGTWTPTSDTEAGVIAVRTNAATATTLNFDGVQVYEGTTAPTLTTQINGTGAYPPIGIVNAASCDPVDIGGWAITTDAGARSGYLLKTASASAATTYYARYLIDASLISPDDYTRGEIDVEVWGRFMLQTNLTSTTIVPSITTYGSSTRYTHEWGSTGVLLTKQSASNYTFNRLGTLTFTASRGAPERQHLTIQGNVGSGSSGNFGLDYLVLVPAKSRALSPTGKPYDSAYPYFLDGTAANKIILSDLSGAREVGSSNRVPDHGLGGSLIEVPQGSARFVVKTADVVPDDPTATANADVGDTASISFAPTPRYQFMRDS